MLRLSAIFSGVITANRHCATGEAISKIAKELKAGRGHNSRMTKNRLLLGTAALALTLSLFAQKTARELPGPGTETIYSIAHVKSGMETRYAELSAKTWAIYRRLDLVLPAP